MKTTKTGKDRSRTRKSFSYINDISLVADGIEDLDGRRVRVAVLNVDDYGGPKNNVEEIGI